MWSTRAIVGASLVLTLAVAGSTCSGATDDDTDQAASATSSSPIVTEGGADGKQGGAPTTIARTVPDSTVFSYSPDGGDGLSLDAMGDADADVVEVPGMSRRGLRTGNGTALPAADGNDIPDGYLQFGVDDRVIFEGDPTTRAVIEIEYLDEGSDTFLVQYDSAVDGFTDGPSVHKTDTGEVLTASFPLCDVYFGNRTHGSDLRISDDNNGADTILGVSLRLVEAAGDGVVINVDDAGADPYDGEPDSEAIQAAIGQTCSGDTVRFTSGGGDPDYRGYLIDRTVFLVVHSAKSDLTFESTDPDDHAALQATADLQGVVVRLAPRDSGLRMGLVDDITFRHLDIDGNRAERVCTGEMLPDQDVPTSEGVNDDAGSWFGDCAGDIAGDSYCLPSSLSLAGGFDAHDPAQDYRANPDTWSTGFVVHDVVISNTECGTAFFFEGADFTIDSVTIDVAGEHTHAPGCSLGDADDPVGAWADGITFIGPGHRVTNSLVMDASDIGITMFGGRDVQISGNTVTARPGNNGMFAAIAIGPNTLGDIGGVEVTGNQVLNEADPTCGGIHAGIVLGIHTWANGCMSEPAGATYGVAEDCTDLSPPPNGALCDTDTYCRTWGHVPPGETLTLRDNLVVGAQVGYVISGLDVLGDLDIADNAVTDLQLVDWEGDTFCEWDGSAVYEWGVLDYVAFNPPVDGWVEQPMFCMR